MTGGGEVAAIPAIPRPAASVLLVREGPAAPLEVYMIRRDPRMRFLGGYYAFPGGKVDEADGLPALLARCRGLDADAAERVVPAADGVTPLAFWVAAARELLEETGVLVACDAAGDPVKIDVPAVAERVAAVRGALMSRTGALAELLSHEAWWLDLGRFRYLSHFITPPSSPIRFTARFFLAPVPVGQTPHLYTEEASEGFWIEPAVGVAGYEEGRMPMAEPAESGLRYLAEFASLDALWAAHADGRHKFHGIADRIAAAGVVMDRRSTWGAQKWPPMPPDARRAPAEPGRSSESF